MTIAVHQMCTGIDTADDVAEDDSNKHDSVEQKFEQEGDNSY